MLLGKANDFDDGTMREIEVGPEGSGDKTVVLVHRHSGTFYATSPACSHYGGALRKGVTSGGKKGGPPTVSCCLHDGTFDLQTGIVVRGPSLDGIATYKVTVADGNVYADVPAALAAGTAEHSRLAPKLTRRDPADKRTFALVGGGAAALAAAETLRTEGFRGRIVMLSREAHLPYDRVVLSKISTRLPRRSA